MSEQLEDAQRELDLLVHKVVALTEEVLRGTTTPEQQYRDLVQGLDHAASAINAILMHLQQTEGGSG